MDANDSRGRVLRYLCFVQNSRKSAPDARYTVYHKGGKTEFSVNQTIDGGTWVYLGRFKFNKGKNSGQAKVVLTNFSSFADKIITADAVKIGGGMGNIARNPNAEGMIPNTKSSDSADVSKLITKPTKLIEPTISAYPRYTEGARYWLQWAGIPDSIYSYNKVKTIMPTIFNRVVCGSIIWQAVRR